MLRLGAPFRASVGAGLILAACGFPDYGYDRGGEQLLDASTDADASHEASAAAGGKGGSGGIGSGGLPDGGGTTGAGGASGGAGGGTGGSDGGPTGCISNADCTTDPGGLLCFGRRCVECRIVSERALPDGGLERTECPAGTRCTEARRCDPGCEADLDCVGVASVPYDAGLDGAVRDSGRSDAGTPDGAATDSGTDSGAPDARADSGGRDARAESGARDASSDGAADGAADSGAKLVCNLVTHTCTGCVRDDDCPSGSLCDVDHGRCTPGCNPGRACPVGFACCGDVCTNPSRSPEHCGTCDVSCVRDGGLGACVLGKCQSDECRPGFADCDADPTNGCETNIAEDPDNCGVCMLSCTSKGNTTPACNDGVCGFGSCLTNFADCDPLVADCESNLTLSAGNCGTCGFACTLLEANSTCNQSTCALTNCLRGHANCDQLASTGCEVSTQDDPSNCGACGKVCSFANADAKCVSGKCYIKACLGSTADCNLDLVTVDGCEVNTSSDVDNCSECGTPCALAHAQPSCSDGVCVIAACIPPFADCDTNPANGCETNLDTNPKSCSACGLECSTNHGTASCALGACSIACGGGFKNCDTDVANGCETSTSNNVENCGVCDKVCSTTGGTPNCKAGICGLSTCGGSLADCNASSTDGCEIDTDTNVANCGGCGKTCFFANVTAQCVAGACTFDSTQCNAGFADCDGLPDNGCEARLNTLTRCGGCNQPCSLPHANASCVSGTCEIASCVTPFEDCSGAPGCETDTTADPLHCGSCDTKCNSTNGTAKCLAGSCGITCDTGFANCNAGLSDGCEQETRDDVNNCGACGAVCAVQNGAAACIGKTCSVASCTPPFDDCDHAYSTGCEVNTDTRITHCGACGNACDDSKGTPTCTDGECITP